MDDQAANAQANPLALSRRVRPYALLAAGAWTALIAASLLWGLSEDWAQMLDLARIEARAGFDKDVLYRRWNSWHGGVYVPVTPESPPNPLLAHLAERDQVTESGLRLTLVNPAYMTRQVFDLATGGGAVGARITSLKPLRAGNAADAWERQALEAFERGATEVASLDGAGDDRRFRLMKAFRTEKNCLKCHGHQGYREGDVRGGISVSVPMGKYLASWRADVRKELVIHGTLFLAGLGMIVAAAFGAASSLRRREETAEALLAAERANSALLKAIPDNLFVTRRDGTFVDVRAQDASTLLAPPADHVGKRAKDLLPADLAAAADACALAAITTGQPQQLDYPLTINGREEHFEARFVGRGADEALALVRNVTERKRAEVALRSSEERLRRIIECSPMGFYFYRLDEQGRLVFSGANPAADRLLKVDHRQYLGKTLEEAFPELSHTEVPRRYRDIILSGSTWGIEELRYRDERVSGVFEVLAYRTGARELVVNFREITEKVRARSERELLEAQLRQAQKMEAMGQLAGGVAHDFNNLLTAILGYCDLLACTLPSGDPNRADVLEIRAAATRAAALTRQLLAFSRKQILQPRVFRLSDAVLEVQKMLRRVLGEDVEVLVQAAADTGFVRADPGQMHQVLLNLTVNARDAMPSGGTLTILTSNVDCDEGFASSRPGLSPGPHVRLTVSDTGTGMDEATLARLFEPFFTTKEVGKGTGLGLATVHGIVTQSGGHIDVRSEPGKGSTFDLYFPRVPQAGEAGSEEGVDAPRGSETVLVVEDAKDLRALTCRILRGLGYRVLDAGRGESALQILQAYDGKVDLLLTDVVMPGMSGAALAEAAGRLRPDLKILYTSGYTDDAVVRHGVQEAGLHFIQKPFSPTEIGRKVREVLG